MNFSYTALLNEHRYCVAEKTESYSFFSERHLQAIWLEQKYFKGIRTLKGEEIQVVSPGMWNQEAGPDFLKAHLLIGGKEVKGDIELHLDAQDWFHHGHHTDERYDKVVLHVSLRPPREPTGLSDRTPPIHELVLEPFLTIPEARIVKLVDLDLYPYKQFVGSGHCAKLLFSRITPEESRRIFAGAAEWRLVKKEEFLAAHAPAPSLRFLTGVAMALGYKNNSMAFLGLFQWLHSLGKKDEETLFALSLGAAGFFNEAFRKKWGSSEKYINLMALYMMAALGEDSLPAVTLKLSHIRPLNHPVRRLAALVKFLTDPAIAELEGRARVLWEAESPKGKWGQLHKQLLELIPSYEDPYWMTHYTFESSSRTGKLPLIGNQIKHEIIINVLLPILYKTIADKGGMCEIDRLNSYFSHMKAAETGKKHYLVHRFFGDSPKGAILDNAMMQQGSYQLHRDFCIHYEASCAGCPFVGNYKKLTF